MKAIDRLKAAYAAKARGDYQTALGHLVWFHDHALEETPALLGIRLSYALAYWIELGAEFPPALESLREIRDRKVADLRAGQHDGQLFLDVSAINDYLGEGEGTYLLFVELRHRAAAFAARCAPIALPAVVDAQDYVLAKLICGEPSERITQAAKDHADGIKELAGKRDRESKETLMAFTANYLDEVRLLIDIYQHTDGPEAAQRLRLLASTSLADAECRQRAAMALGA